MTVLIPLFYCEKTILELGIGQIFSKSLVKINKGEHNKSHSEVITMENSRFEEAYNEYRKQGLDNSHRESELSGLNNGNGERVEYVRKNDDGDIIAFKTSKNRELDYLQALEEIRKGNLLGLDVFHKYGRDIIRSEPDGIQENNLDNLPEF